MADRYDPKLSLRPANDRKAGGNPASQGNDDPLAELAKLVSGRAAAPVPTAQPPKARTVPAANDSLPTAAEQADALADLEAELLSDLQASFAAVKGAIAAPPLAPAASPPQAVPPPPVPEPKAVEPVLRTVPPPVAAQSAPPQRSAARPPLQAVPPLQPVQQAAPAPEPVRPAAPPPQKPAPAPENKVEIANLQLRPSAPPASRPPLTVVPPPAETPAAKETREKASRWEKPAEPQRPSAAVISRFAPPRVAAQNAQPVPPVAPPAPEKLDDLPFGDGPPFGTPHAAEEEEFPLDGFDLPPIGDEEQGQVYPDEELAHIGRRRFPRGVAILGGVLAVVIVGGAAAMYLRSSGNGVTTPPVILADTSPTKITPPPSQTPANDPQNKLIYDRVDSKAPAKPADTKLVTPGSEPIASVPSSTASDNPISRVILPGAPGPDGKPAQAAADQPSLADSEIGADGKPIGPRKVRTVVVKPDGTIVSSEAAPVDAQAGAQASVNPAVAPALPPSTTDDTAAISGQQNGKELAITPVPGTPTSLPPEQKQPVQAPAAKQTPVTVVHNDPPPTPKPAQPPQQQQQQQQQKVVDSSAPIDLTPGRPAAGRPAPQQQQAALQPQQAQQPAAPPAGGGMLVQISSQRSEDAARATYRDLQARYPNVLGNYQPNIQRADLGDRGVYYRVRVGPFAGSDAQRVCDALKAAGGDCVLAAR